MIERRPGRPTASMAPTSSDPRQIMVVLDAERRNQLHQLVHEITAYMHSQLELHEKSGGVHAEHEHEPSSLASQTGAGASAPSDEVGSTPDASRGSAKVVEVDASISQRRTPPSRGLVDLRRAALAHFDAWRAEFLDQLAKLGVLSKDDDAQALEERRKRSEKMAQMRADVPAEGEDLLSFGEEAVASSVAQDTATAIEALQAVYHPIPTALTNIPIEDRKEVLSAVLILLLSTGHYSAYSRTFINYLTSALNLTLSYLTSEEKEVAKTMIETSTEAEKAKESGQMSAELEAQKRKQQNQVGRFWKVGLASVAGAAIIGVTGGLAAPVVAGAIGGLMGSVGLGGLASFLGIFWMNGALVGTLFGAFGARMTVSFPSKCPPCRALA